MSENESDKIPYVTPYFRSVEYSISLPEPVSPELHPYPSVAFAGRSNSGKSSLISALCDHKNLARSSKTAGKTRMLNYFIIPSPLGDQNPAYLIDMPGYGYAKISGSEREALSVMIESFFNHIQRLSLLVIVLDSRRSIAEEERSIMRFCAAAGVKIIFARTKWDTLNSDEKKKVRKKWQSEGITDLCLPLSSTKKKGLEPLLELIRERLTLQFAKQKSE